MKTIQVETVTYKVLKKRAKELGVSISDYVSSLAELSRKDAC